jgi:hypothetical protein
MFLKAIEKKKDWQDLRSGRRLFQTVGEAKLKLRVPEMVRERGMVRRLELEDLKVRVGA